MFKNSGPKIQILAKVLFWINTILSVITGFILTIEEDPAFVALIFAGPLIFWIFSLLIYGFGELIENSDTLVKSTHKKYDDPVEKIDKMHSIEEENHFND